MDQKIKIKKLKGQYIILLYSNGDDWNPREIQGVNEWTKATKVHKYEVEQIYTYI